MLRSVLISTGLHVALFLIAWFGLPDLFDEAPLNMDTISVEVVTVDEFSAAPTKAQPQPKPEEKPKPTPKPDPKPAPKPDPKPAPKPAPAPEPKPEPQPAPEPAPEPKPEPKPEPAPKAEPVPTPEATKKPEPTPELADITPQSKPTPPKPEPARKPEPKKAEPKKPEPKKEEPPKRSLADILKDVRKSEPAAESAAQNEPQDVPEENASEVVATRLDARLTMSELDAVKRQIEKCWSPPAGAKEAGSFAVEIHVSANPDGTVRQARISNRSDIQGDPSRRTIAESALRAVLNPQCSPLKLPLDKYEMWRTFTFNFDMREMLGL